MTSIVTASRDVRAHVVAGRSSTWVERLGATCGEIVAPLIGSVSRARRARMFHPEGVVYAARVEPISTAAMDLTRVGKALAGPAIVRLSSAWWTGGKEWIDALGMAIRFMRPDHADDQDLLAATIRFPWTTPFAPLATRVSSFLWNHFHAVSPFAIAGVGLVKLRIRSPRIANDHGSRIEHLAAVVARHDAIYQLEARRLDVPFHRRRWEGIARISLERPIDIDQASLRFSPFRVGRGLEPRGFVHHLRLATYAASQRARPRYESPHIADH